MLPSEPLFCRTIREVIMNEKASCLFIVFSLPAISRTVRKHKEVFIVPKRRKGLRIVDTLSAPPTTNS